MRATLKYFPNENMIQATEIPYGVFTNTIIKQLDELTTNDPEYGINKVTDWTKTTADIRIVPTAAARQKAHCPLRKRLLSLKNLAERILLRADGKTAAAVRRGLFYHRGRV